MLCGVPLVRSAMPSSRPSRRYRAIRLAARVGARRPPRGSRRRVAATARTTTARRRGVVRDVLVATVAESYEDELDALRCPVALVWGAEDTTAPVARRERRAGRSCPSATLEVLDGVGHLVPTEAPEPLAAAVRAMLGGAR